MASRMRFRARATSLLSEYQRLERAALDAARRNNASLWYVPDSLYGVYQDSLAATAPVIGQPIGFIADQANIGPELILDQGFDNPSSWSPSQPTSGSVTVSGGSATLTSLDGSYSQLAPFPFVAVTPGAAYLYTLVVTAASGGGGAIRIGNAQGTAITAPGTYTGIVTASASNAILVRTLSTGSITISDISVRPAGSAYALQATTANKPTLSRIPRKYGPERLSGNWITPSGYTNTTTQLSSASFDATPVAGGSTRVAQGLTQMVVGRTYRIKLKLESSGTAAVNWFVREGTDIGAGTVIATGGVGVGLTITAEFVATQTALSLLFVSPSNGKEFSIRDATIREVVEYGHAIQFSGSIGIELGINSTPIPDKSAYTIVVGAQMPDAVPPVALTMFAQRGATGVPIIGKVTVSVTGTLAFQTRDDANALHTVAIAPPAGVFGKGIVVSAGVVAGSAFIAANGGAKTNSVQNLGAASATNGRIGGNNGFSSDPFKGPLNFLAVAPVAMPDADRIDIERFAAFLAGAEGYAS